MGLEVKENPITRQELFYRDYMTRMSGVLTPEKEQMIHEEQIRLEDAVQLRGEVLHIDVTDEQQLEQIWQTIHDAVQREDAFARFYDRYTSLLAEPNTQRQANMSLVYDTGWNKLLQGGYDFFAYLCIAVLASILITQEHDSRFWPILCTTARGRSVLFRTKLQFAALLSGTLALLFWLSDIALVDALYSLPDPGVTLMSLADYREVPATWTLGGYLAVLGILRLLSTVGMTLLFTALSAVLKNGLITLLITVVTVPLPAMIFSSDGLPWRPSDLLDGDALLHRGFATHAWQTTAIVTIYLFICTAAICFAYTRYDRNIRKRREKIT